MLILPLCDQQSFSGRYLVFGNNLLEMTKGTPPYADLNPMVALIKISKNDPPKLDGNYSSAFKDFVAQCLIKDPQRVYFNEASTW